jgi:23S rRNA pseudouridine2457 synthase
MYRYFLIYKPYGMLSQFSGEGNTLKGLGYFPSDVYPVGRLDKDSEGLLIITNDKKLNHLLLDPNHGHQREYYVQVEGCVTKEAIYELESGVSIQIEKRQYRTKRAFFKSLEIPPNLPERMPPVRYRKTVPDTWVSLTLVEGKNRQVRKMTAAVGLPTLRLVRWRIERLTIEGFTTGQVVEMSRGEMYAALRLSDIS